MTRLLKASRLLSRSCCSAAASPGVDPAVQSKTGALTNALEAGVDPGNLDILFMIDNSSSMTQLQMKMLDQDPGFMTVLQNLTNGLPNVHVAVVSSDMGAPGDATASIACTTDGDDGAFQSTPRGACTDDDAHDRRDVHLQRRRRRQLHRHAGGHVFGCIAQLGDKGCGFEHQLASVARALGADGASPPRREQRTSCATTPCWRSSSSPTRTTAPRRPTPRSISLNVGGSNQQNIANALGPIANYRCNQFGHLCIDPASATPTALISPPLNPPTDAQGTATAPTLNLTNCESNDTGTGLLTPVTDLVAGIRALKADPDNQIVVGAIAPPVTPYTVAWVPEQNGQNTQPGELWPQIEHSCGAAGRRRRQSARDAEHDRRQLRRSGRPDRAMGESVRLQRRRDLDLRPGLFGRISDHRRPDQRPPAPKPVDGRRRERWGRGWQRRWCGLGCGGGRRRRHRGLHRIWHRGLHGIRHRRLHRIWHCRLHGIGIAGSSRRRGHDRRRHRRLGWPRNSRRGRRHDNRHRRLHRIWHRRLHRIGTAGSAGSGTAGSAGSAPPAPPDLAPPAPRDRHRGLHGIWHRGLHGIWHCGLHGIWRWRSGWPGDGGWGQRLDERHGRHRAIERRRWRRHHDHERRGGRGPISRGRRRRSRWPERWKWRRKRRWRRDRDDRCCRHLGRRPCRRWRRDGRNHHELRQQRLRLRHRRVGAEQLRAGARRRGAGRGGAP